jgi:hypothetical protein
MGLDERRFTEWSRLVKNTGCSLFNRGGLSAKLPAKRSLREKSNERRAD